MSVSCLQEDGAPAFIERAGIVNLYRGEEIGSGEVVPLLSGVDEVQPVGQIAKKPELARDDLVLDHPDLDPPGGRPVDGRGRVAVTRVEERGPRRYRRGRKNREQRGRYFAALVRFGVDIDVPFAGQEVGGLRLGERGGALERAGVRGDRQRDTAILARFAGVEVGGGGGS